ncbi:MAG: hypothetical protein J6M60_03540 [Clostridia bacterium]|nr:hypothetical protein [Clostridia bacterium]
MAIQKKIEITLDLTKEDMFLIKKALLNFYFSLIENRCEIGESEKKKYIDRIEVLEQELSVFDKF